MTTVTTKLVIDASGALVVASQFERGMANAGAAVDRVSEANDILSATLRRAAEAQAQGIAVSTVKVAAVSKEVRALERLQLAAGGAAAADAKMNREAQRNAVDAANAVLAGVTTQENAYRLLAASQDNLILKYDASARAAREAMTREAEGMARSVQALRAQIDPVGTAQARLNAELAEYSALAAKGAISARELAAAQGLAQQRFQQVAGVTRQLSSANDNASFSTANLAAQFQDIAVTSAMGMSPLQIALQQGTQISAVLGPMGAAGAVKGLGAAFLSLVNPVSLVTIGLVAGAAAAIQWASSIGDGANAIETEMRSAALSFDGIKSAINELSALQRDYQDALRATSAIHGQTAASIIAETEAEFNAKRSVLELQVRYQKALIDGQRAELQQKQAALRAEIDQQVFTRMDLERRGYADPRIGRFVQVPDDITGLEKTRQLLESSPIALALKKLQAEMALSELAAQQLEKALSTTFQTIGSGADGLDKMRVSSANAYRDLTRSAEERIAQMELELQIAGRAGAGVEALRMQHDMLAQAMRDLGSVTPQQREEIERLAARYGDLSLAIEKTALSSDLAFERDQMGRNGLERRVASEMRRVYGDDYADYMQSAEAGQIRLNERWREAQDELKAVGDLGRDAFTGLLDVLYESGDATEKLISLFGGIGKQFAQMGMDRLWKSISTGQPLFDFTTPQSQGGGGNGAALRVSPTAYAAAGRELGASIAPAISGSLNNSLSSYAAAIRKVESGSYAGDYNAMGPVTRSGDRAYGAYQVMGNNIASWTKEVLGHSLSIQDFLDDRNAQDRVFQAKFGQSLEKFGNFADATSVWFSGRPVSRAGNASDGYNTVPQYIDKANAALEAYPGGIRQGVSDGVVDANRRIGASAPAEPQSAAAGGASLQNLLGVGGAAFGAFAGGYQSGDPLMGGISGALTGLGAAPALSALGLGSAAGPIGLIGGAIIGIIGGIFGKSKQKREELKRAQEELESQMGAITELIATATGDFTGAFGKQFSQITDEFQKAISMAEKAKNYALALELDQAMDEFFAGMTDRWTRGFDGMIESLESGNGFDGAFIAGMDAVEKMKESLIGFVNDAKMFDEANGDLRGYYQARRDAMGDRGDEVIYASADQYRSFSDTAEFTQNEFVKGYRDFGDQLVEKGVQAFTSYGGQLYATFDELTAAAKAAGYALDETGKLMAIAANDNIVLADSVERARQAAIKTALATLSGAEEFTAMESAMQKLSGAAAGLPSLLSDLGLSAEEAAKAIDGALLTAIDELRVSMVDDLQRSINDLGDFGYLNEFIDAQTTYETRLRDLAAIGGDPALAFSELQLSFIKIAESAGLTDARLQELAGVFPSLEGAISGLVGSSTEQSIADATEAMEAAKTAAIAAYERETSVYQDQVSEIEKAISAHEQYIESLTVFRKSLLTDDSLSPLSRRDRLLAAESEYRSVTTAALGGDAEAMGRVEDVSRQYLEDARGYYATSEGYFRIFNDVQDLLGQALGTADGQLAEQRNQLTLAENQIAVLEAARNDLSGISNATLSVAEAVDQLNAATTAQAAAEAARDAVAQAIAIDRLTQMVQLMSGTSSGQDLSGFAYRDLTQFYNDVAAGYAQLQGKVPGFAEGGMHAGGLRIVGERGPEIEATGPSRIWTAEQTRQMVSPNAEIVSELRAARQENAVLSSEIAALRADVKRLTSVMAAAGLQTAEAVKEGNDILAAVRSDLRKKA